jgi:MFS family permease
MTLTARWLDRDLARLWASVFLRSVAAGFVGIYLGFELARRGLDPEQIGLAVSAGLAGQTLASFVVTLRGDRFGRRRALVVLGLLAVGGGLAAARVEGAAPLAAVAFLGLLNGMGRDRGPALVLEQAALPALVPAERRTWTLALYNVLGDAGHALGALLVALLPLGLAAAPDAGAPSAAGFLLYAALLAPGVVLAATLSRRVEAPAADRPGRITPATRARLAKICALFGIDSFAGGFLTSALLSWFFFERFGASAATVGALFAAARVLNALSHLGAAWLARRIGLVPTMVFTHLPSSLLLATVPFAPSFGIAALLFLLREGLVEMDVPTRQSYVLAVVQPEERTFASGATHLVRTLGWALGPACAGWATLRFGLAAPLLIAAALKIAYDLALWRSFHAVRPPEEAAAAAGR